MLKSFQATGLTLQPLEPANRPVLYDRYEVEAVIAWMIATELI